jgi:hypothetical protein
VSAWTRWWTWLWRGSLVLAGLALAAFATGLVLRAQIAPSGDAFDQLVGYSNVYAFALAAASAAAAMVAVAARRRNAGTPAPGPRVEAEASPLPQDRQPLQRAAEALREAVRRQWSDEAAVRGLRRPRPMRIRWAATIRPVAAHAAEVLDDEVLAGRTVRLRLHGDVNQVVARFRCLPHRQLVVLGEPGAGKSVLAMLFTLGLLTNAELAEPAPVLLSLPSWNPTREHLHTWMARRLAEDYPFLANTATYGPHAAARLVETGCVLPVLDGLDELPAALHPAAIDAIDRAITGGRPVLLTCRSDDYQAAVSESGHVLAQAAVVELEPVQPDDAAAFLTAAGPGADHRWRAVFYDVRDHPHGPLSQTLTSPLAVWLARIVYSDPSTDPRELLNSDGFGDVAAIRRHLLQAFINAIYAEHPPSPVGVEQAVTTRMRYQPAQARRWLAYLARHTDHGELLWWRLSGTVPRWARALIEALIIGPVAAVAAWRALDLTPGVATLVGLAMAVLNGAISGRKEPTRLQFRGRALLKPLVVGLAKWLILAIVIGLVAGVVGGLIGVLIALAGMPLGLADGSDLVDAGLIGGTFATKTLLLLWLVAGLAIELGELVQAPPAADQFISPRSVLRNDRTVTGIWTLAGSGMGVVFGLLGGLLLDHDEKLVPTTGLAVELALLMGFAAALGSAWGRFLITRIWLALQGGAPLRLMRFLDDAHHRGVLRQAGAAYQFRHIQLQEYLAEQQT